ncbi:MAG TPA: tRNA pseudouridine(55) synthase TruB [Caulobacteraceae bacterium]|nr:tRNA pseudouridine(55) synthase TruB [Caulobacteraceae bacterium]
MPRRRKGEAVSGWINLDKPEGVGSTEAVNRVRRAFNARKAGHAGALDPLATGVLPIALGEATKAMPVVAEAAKTYVFAIAWGETTSTLDREGEVVARSDVRPGREAIEAALPRFVGEIEQAPPAFSAVRVSGQRAYDLARRGETPELAPRQVVIHSARLLAHGEAETRIEIVCGKGTYVRSLARDLAEVLGACAHVGALRRTAVGRFAAERAISLALLEELCHRGAALEALLPVETALDDIPALAVTAEDAFRLAQGRSIVLLPRQVDALRERLAASRAVSAMHAAKVVALCEMRAGRLNPTRVFNY